MPGSERCIIVLERSVSFREGIYLETRLCQADRDVFRHDISYRRSFLSHFHLKITSLFPFCIDLCIKLLLSSNKVICWFFCLYGMMNPGKCTGALGWGVEAIMPPCPSYISCTLSVTFPGSKNTNLLLFNDILNGIAKKLCQDMSN